HGPGVLVRNLEVDVAAVGHQADVAIAAGLGGRRALLAAAAARSALAGTLPGLGQLADLNLVGGIVRAEFEVEDLRRLASLGGFLRGRRVALLGRRYFPQLQVRFAAQAERAGHFVDVLGAEAEGAPIAEGTNLFVLGQLFDLVRRQVQNAGGLF